VHASFFLIGRNALVQVPLARRILNEGHTVAYHSFSHPLLARIAPSAAKADIDRGFAAVDEAVYGRTEHAPTTPFFRFPGFASSPLLLEWLEQRGIMVFGADLWADDWNPISPQQELALALGRIEANQGGIVLLHDSKARTAAMLPALLRALKVRGYGVVHVVSPTQGVK
jgi:peptidoglycan-N-acetylglucosamine deacetylase